MTAYADSIFVDRGGYGTNLRRIPPAEKKPPRKSILQMFSWENGCTAKKIPSNPITKERRKKK
jgi:hypothetical protein